jgi:hypothetical protein
MAISTVFTMKMNRDTFEDMIKEFPLIKKELIEEANFRQLVNKYSQDIRNQLFQEEATKVISKFNELSQDQTFDHKQE